MKILHKLQSRDTPRAQEPRLASSVSASKRAPPISQPACSLTLVQVQVQVEVQVQVQVPVGTQTSIGHGLKRHAHRYLPSMRGEVARRRGTPRACLMQSICRPGGSVGRVLRPEQPPSGMKDWVLGAACSSLQHHGMPAQFALPPAPRDETSPADAVCPGLGLDLCGASRCCLRPRSQLGWKEPGGATLRAGPAPRGSCPVAEIGDAHGSEAED
uniref:Magnesium transporter MRS2 n=1 Tax=Macaca mulatta TaxID=9544 RepID=A0A5F7ZNZ2_MACMU